MEAIKIIEIELKFIILIFRLPFIISKINPLIEQNIK